MVLTLNMLISIKFHKLQNIPPKLSQIKPQFNQILTIHLQLPLLPLAPRRSCHLCHITGELVQKLPRAPVIISPEIQVCLLEIEIKLVKCQVAGEIARKAFIVIGDSFVI